MVAPPDEVIDAASLFNEMDLNGDGVIDMSEMCHCFQAHLEFDGTNNAVDMMVH